MQKLTFNEKLYIIIIIFQFIQFLLLNNYYNNIIINLINN